MKPYTRIYDSIKRKLLINGSNALSFLEALWIIGYCVKNRLYDKKETIDRIPENILLKKPLKIGIVTEYYYPVLGGITENVHNSALKLLERGHDVRIITPYAGEPKRDIGPLKDKIIYIGKSVPIYYNQSYARISIGTNLIEKVIECFEREKFDLLHVHSPITPVLPIITIVLSKVPIVATLHTQFNSSRWLKIWKPYLEKYILSKISTFISVSEIGMESLKKFFPYDFNYKIIPNGVDIDTFTPEGNREHPVFKDKRYINLLYIGRFDPRNGLSTVIEAFKLLADKYKNLRLLIVGYGPLKSHYESMVPNRLKDRVIFLGKLDEERPVIYRGSYVVCVPFKMASFGITIIEALASGTPVIGTDIPAFRKLIKHGYNGFLAENTPSSFANYIEILLNDPFLCYKMRQNARLSSLKYSWDKIIDQVLEVYYSLGERENITKNYYSQFSQQLF